jgi:hypothetical protein
MGTGPVLECSTELVDRLPSIVASQHIRLTSADSPSDIFFDKRLDFRRRLGRVVGHQQNRKTHSYVWLTAARPLNPMFWYFDLSLIREIERTLVAAGATRQLFKVLDRPAGQ